MFVQRANVILEISDNESEIYLAKGFNILDDNMNVVKKCMPNDIGGLKLAYVEHTKKISELEAQVEKLDAQLKAQKKKQ